MKRDLLNKEIALQLDFLDATVREIVLLRSDLVDREPTHREIAAAAAFMADFYGGIENILKRISYHYNVDLPRCDNWHVELFARFCTPGYPGLPVLIEEDLKEPLAAYRRFRHVAHHGYALHLQWGRMVEGVQSVDQVYLKFKAKLQKTLP